MTLRKPSVAGTWYPGTADALGRAVDGHLSAAVGAEVPIDFESLVALVAPHAGLRYSGPVAAHAYRLLRARDVDVAVLVGPSHFLAFDGVSLYRGGFATPFGIAALDEPCAAAIASACPLVRELVAAHEREHSLEMQLPFLQRVAPRATIVPLLIGRQTGDTVHALGEALGHALRGRRAVLVASTDLSHYHDARSAAEMDAVVIDHIARLDADGLEDALSRRPDHACGGGPTVAVMLAARALGARDAVILRYGDSGDVSGDKSSVVGYVAAALGVVPHGRAEA